LAGICDAGHSEVAAEVAQCVGVVMGIVSHVNGEIHSNFEEERRRKATEIKLHGVIAPCEAFF
jgi:hypothetical protein